MDDFSQSKPDSYSWKTPQVVIEDSCQKLIEKGKVIIPRVLPLILIIEYALYIYLKFVLPDDIEIKTKLPKIFFFVFLYAAVPLFVLFIIFPMIRRRFGVRRKVTKNGFKWSDKHIPWKWIIGYWIESCDEFPGLKKIIFKTKHRLYVIYLPEDETQHSDILQFLDTHTSMIEPQYPEPTFVLSKRQLLLCWSFAIAVSILAAALVIMFQLGKFMLFFGLGMLLGPGTVSMILIYGKKFLKDKQLSYACILNWAAFLLFMTIVFLAELYKYHKIIESH